MSDSDCDWFDKDDEELFKDVQKTVKTKQQANTEYIKTTTNTLDDYIKELTLKAAAHNKGDAKKNKIKITDLRKLSTMTPLDIFLYTTTLEYDFFMDQIYLNDSQEKVILYTSVLATICRLELPGFHKDVLKSFSLNSNLHEQFRLLVAKLMCKRFKDMWLKEEEMLQFINNMELLILQSFKLFSKEENGNLLLKDLLNILEQTDNVSIKKKKIVIQLKENLEQALKQREKTEDTLDIFPTLEDLTISQSQSLNNDLEIIKQYSSQQSVQEYLSKHLEFLKQDFLLPLKDCVDMLKNKRSTTELPDNFYVYENVLIVLNEQFLDAYRHELVFVDVLGSRRNMDTEDVQMPYQLQEKLRKIKSGALLCFSTSYNFDNLILATVTYTSHECMKEGFIGIEIVRQYNIGNIYNRKLLMFETPAFFEPYHNVFNYLKNSTITNFPMKNYIVDGENPQDKIPSYLNENTVYQCYGQTFKPLKEEPPQNVLGLNDSQLQAFGKALKQEFTLIQGPPGTGKTYLSVQMVKTLIENAETPLVLITYTNESLDKFLIKISEYTDKIVRFGSQSRDPAIAKYNIKDVVEHSQINPKLKRLYYLINIEFKTKFQNLQLKHKEFDGTDDTYQEILKAQRELAEVTEKLQTIRIMFQYYVAKEKFIIALTTTCAAKTNFLFRLLKSKIVIFEEAAEILESHVVACLTPYTQHVIMIGDHQQLQPYSSSYQLQQYAHMNISLFERIFTKQSEPIQLKTQYRMHPKIADLLCNTIYKDLNSDDSVTQYPAIRKMSTNLFFMTHNIKEAKTQYDSSLYNPYEVEEIINLSLHLIENAEYAAEDIHILSPYAKQVDLIKKQLQKYPSLYNLKASTVDSFQGLECNIILLSLVRNNTIPQIGFLKQTNRICVALSRAKHGMYIIGNLQLLSQCSSTWLQIQEKLLQQNAMGPKFPIEA
ncbi:NFX1-type zinc finger-containing protein 1 [Lucilia cuprina]|nr:NFX1-type zinc finger-containing protein 1 [Lucilia cuprina]